MWADILEWFFPMPRCKDEREYLDSWDQGDFLEIAENLADMERIVGLIGIPERVMMVVEGLLESESEKKTFRVLDIATGPGWVPRLISNLSEKSGVVFNVVSVDINPEVVKYARYQTPAHTRVKFVIDDVRYLKYSPDSFDLVICSMSLHHFSQIEAVKLISKIDQVASKMWLVCDLLRNRWAYWATAMVTRLMSSNRITRHDGPLSIRRAYTSLELQELVKKAGVQDVKMEKWGRFCVAITRDFV